MSALAEESRIIFHFYAAEVVSIPDVIAQPVNTLSRIAKSILSLRTDIAVLITPDVIVNTLT